MHDTPPLDGRDEEDEPVEDPLRDKARRRRKADFVRRPVVPARVTSSMPSTRDAPVQTSSRGRHRLDQNTPQKWTSDESELGALEELFRAAIVSSRALPPSS